MGLGDEVMVTALAKKNMRKYNRPSIILNKNEQFRWHTLWENNPNIINPTNPYEIGAPMIFNGSGSRHYIDWANSDKDHFTFKEWDIEPGEIYFSREEDFFNRAAKHGQTDILIDSGVKDNLRENKKWPLKYWLKLASILADNELSFSINDPAKSPNLRYWLGDLTRYKAIICHEGGLHHVAVALGIPCVTIFGGYISPRITGYNLPTFKALTHAKEFCGLIRSCSHCKEEMERIKPMEVFESLQEVLANAK